MPTDPFLLAIGIFGMSHDEEYRAGNKLNCKKIEAQQRCEFLAENRKYIILEEVDLSFLRKSIHFPCSKLAEFRDAFNGDDVKFNEFLSNFSEYYYSDDKNGNPITIYVSTIPRNVLIKNFPEVINLL